MLSKLVSIVAVLLFVGVPVGVLGWIYEQLNQNFIGAIIFCLGVVGYLYTVAKIEGIK